MTYKKFNWSCLSYSAGQIVEVLEGCNCITFTNYGDSTAIVNNKQLFPGTIGSIAGDSLTIGGNEGEVLSEKRVTISFTGGTTNNLEIIQKYYL